MPVAHHQEGERCRDSACTSLSLEVPKFFVYFASFFSFSAASERLCYCVTQPNFSTGSAAARISCTSCITYKQLEFGGQRLIILLHNLDSASKGFMLLGKGQTIGSGCSFGILHELKTYRTNRSKSSRGALLRW